MDQDATWYGGGPRPRPHCARWEPSFPCSKRGRASQFSARLFWPNGWMDQDATSYVGRPRPRPQCYMETHPPIFGPCLLWPNGRPSQLLLSTCQARQDRQVIMEKSFQAVDHTVTNKDCFCPVFVLYGRHCLKKISNLCSFMWSSYAWNDGF